MLRIRSLIVLLASVFAVETVLLTAPLLPATAQAQTRDNLVSFPTADLEVRTSTGTANLTVELAFDPTRWQQGLMFREELAEDAGMLFAFPREQVLSFWMKNTLIPLDMIFADGTGKIVHIVYNAEPETLTGRSSEVPAQLVLEVAAGVADALNIQVGDNFTLPVTNIQQPPQSL